MTRPAWLLIGSLAAAALAAGACHRPTVAPPPPPPRADLVVLLPEPDDGPVGAVTVTTPSGRVELTRANDATRVVAGQAPAAPAPMPAEEIQRRFGEALAACPPAPRTFLLYFQSGGDTLTAESQALLPEILDFVAHRAAPDVTVIGHTDTTGDAASNAELGRRRATLIRGLLINSGLDPALVEAVSHGEADLLVPTPDNTAEARNRRVEVTVR